MLRRVATTLVVSFAYAEFYDVIQSTAKPPAGGCQPWADAKGFHKYFRDKANIAKSGSSCVQTGNGNPSSGSAHTYGAYCIGASSGKVEWCTSDFGVPEQINIQIASPTEVVLNFVTFEESAPTGPPIVRLGSRSGHLTQKVEGVTHLHKTHGGREIYMHFVELTELTEKERIYYTVQAGGDHAEVSEEFSFRAPYSAGETRIALYGDMGVYTWNNMANLEKDTVTDEAMDLIVHAGDHCYNEGDSDERRADGYMQAFQQTLARTPWMPIVGNHEFYADAQLRRYLDQTWEKWGPLETASTATAWATTLSRGESNARSHLGALLGAGVHHAASMHSVVPSNTSRYFSVNFGLVHLVGLTLNGYNGVDTCTDTCNQQQLAWLEEDLRRVDRSVTPWVIAMSHFPLYLDEMGEDDYDSGPLSAKEWLNAEECEYCGHCLNCSVPGYSAASPSNKTLKSAQNDLEPLFYKYGVDLYWAGHIHFYQTFNGPLRGGKLVGQGTYNPKGVIHVCSGNGGPPSPSACRSHPHCKLCIEQPYSYTRLIAHNATDLTWRQISNKDGSIIDEWVLHQDKHGPF